MDEKVAYVFRLFDFFNFLFRQFSFLSCYSGGPSTGLASSLKNSEKASSRRAFFFQTKHLTVLLFMSFQLVFVYLFILFFLSFFIYLFISFFIYLISLILFID